MSVRRAYVNKDAWITEKSLTANFGGSPILETWNIFDSIKGRKEFARIVASYNLSALTADISAGNLVDPRTDTTVTAYLYMFNAKHGDEQAKSFNLNVHPITQEWDEGDGLDNDNLSQTGYASAVSAQSTVAWTTTGGTFQVDSNSATQTFDHGEEDLKVDITNMFKEWLAGNTGNFGVMIKMTDNQEIKTGALSATSIFTKKFYGKETNTRKRSYIQLEWPGQIKDDRSAISFNSTGQLWFYNIVNNQLQDLNGTGPFPGNVTLSGVSGDASVSALHTALTAARHAKGLYKCNIGTMPLTGSDYASFKDNWFISASPTANYTHVFTAIDPASGFSDFQTSKYRITYKNLQRTYEKGAKARLRIHIKDDKTTFTALTAASTAVSTFICTDGTIEFRELQTDDIEIPAYQISHDSNGNFVELDTNNLYIGVDYKPVLKLQMRGETIIIDEPDKHKFRVI